MNETETIRQAIRQAHRWRDVLWQAVIAEFEDRNPAAARAAHQSIAAHPAHLLVGSATQRAALAWPYLDAQARREWIWACQCVHQMWFRDYLATDMSESA